MATVVHRTTLERRDSVSTPEFDPTVWLINPSLPNAPSKYWKIAGDWIDVMTAEEKAEVDAIELESRRHTAIGNLKRLGDLWMANAGYPIEVQSAANALYVEGVALGYANRITYLQPILDVAKSIMGRFNDAAIYALTSIEPEMVPLDLSDLIPPSVVVSAAATMNS